MNQENQNKLSDIAAQKDGELVGSSLQEQYRLAAYYVKSGLLPKEFNTVEKALIAIQFCYSLGIKPAIGLRQVCVINGKPSIWGDMPLALVRRSEQLKNITEYLINNKNEKICPENKNITDDPFAAVCILERIGGEKIERFFTIQDAERAGLLSRGECWKKYPKDMLKYRARSQAIKDLFSDILAGAAIAEYDYGILPERGITKIEDKQKGENDKIAEYFENIPEPEPKELPENSIVNKLLKQEPSAGSQNADNIS